jgi:hypothetical protein
VHVLRSVKVAGQPFISAVRLQDQRNIETMSKRNIHSHAHLNSNVLKLASLAKMPFARDCAKMLEYFLEIEDQVPANYRWRFTPTKYLTEQLALTKSATEWNNLYWRDIAENLQAFSVLSYRRGLGIIRPAVRSLNTGDILASAVLARTALELSAWSIYNTSDIDALVRAIPADLDVDKTHYTANGLQTQLVKMLFGTRLETAHDELQQINILTILDKLTKKDTADFLRPAYAYLSDATHPNVVGNAEFWEFPTDASNSKPFTVNISTSVSAAAPNELLEYTLASLGWSSACLRNNMIHAATANEAILAKFG